MDSIIIVYLSLALVCIGPLLVILAIIWAMGTDDISDRLYHYANEASGLGEARQSNEEISYGREIKGTFVSRVFVPPMRSIGNFMGSLTPTGTLTELARQLTVAGNPLGLQAREFYGLRTAGLLLGLGLGGFILLNNRETPMVLLGIGLGGLVAYMPTMWLRSAMRGRQKKIRKAFPDALDMLAVCSTAGLGFDQAMQRVSEYWNNPVGEEFGRVISEMEMGFSRKKALHNMVERVDVADVSSFVSFVLQTEQLGLSVSDTLTSQAEYMRIERRLRAQEQAQKVPSKMVLPMAFLIFPALLALILGPAVPDLLGFFDSFTQ